MGGVLADMPPGSINAGALRAAVGHDHEGLRTEFKRSVGASEDDKAEWARDVTAFANTSGGVLLVGAVAADGVLTSLPGVPGNVDDEVLRLDSILRDRVDPTVPGLELRRIEVDGANVIVAIIPRSWRAPHLVRASRSRWQMTRRNSAGRYVLSDAGEIRSSFVESVDAEGSAARWHDDQVAAVLAGQTPMPVVGGPVMVMTFRPLGAGAPGATNVLDVRNALGDLRRHFRPLTGGAAIGARPNVHGVYVADSETTASSYAQLFRDGALTYVDHYPFAGDEGIVASGVLGQHILTGVVDAGDVQSLIGAQPPSVMQVTIHGVFQMELRLAKGRARIEDPFFTADHLRLPAVFLDTMDAGERRRLTRSVLDAIWNAAGLAACESLGDDGTWRPS